MAFNQQRPNWHSLKSRSQTGPIWVVYSGTFYLFCHLWLVQVASRWLITAKVFGLADQHSALLHPFSKRFFRVADYSQTAEHNMLDNFLLNTEIQASQPHCFNKTIFSKLFMEVDYRFLSLRRCFSGKWLQVPAMYTGEAQKRWEAGVLQPSEWKHHWFQFLCGFTLWLSNVGLPQETGTRLSRNNCIT